MLEPGVCTSRNECPISPFRNAVEGSIAGTVVADNHSVVGVVEPKNRFQTLKSISPTVPVHEYNIDSWLRSTAPNHIQTDGVHHSYTIRDPICFAGTPATIAYAGTSLVTIAPAPITAPFPMVIPSVSTTLAATQT